jgi:outer membrane murein-binding lipoprotein Lpp
MATREDVAASLRALVSDFEKLTEDFRAIRRDTQAAIRKAQVLYPERFDRNWNAAEQVEP